MSASEIDIDELLSRTTVKDDLPLSVTGNFSSEQKAKKLLNTVFGFVRVFGAVFDLSALDAITVADDYVAALAMLTRSSPCPTSISLTAVLRLDCSIPSATLSSCSKPSGAKLGFLKTV
jgi:hypothetical protein